MKLLFQQVRLWDTPQRKCKFTVQAHEGFVKAISFCHDDRFISAGQDKTLKIWSSDDVYLSTNSKEPLKVLLSDVSQLLLYFA